MARVTGYTDVRKSSVLQMDWVLSTQGKGPGVTGYTHIRNPSVLQMDLVLSTQGKGPGVTGYTAIRAESDNKRGTLDKLISGSFPESCDGERLEPFTCWHVMCVV